MEKIYEECLRQCNIDFHYADQQEVLSKSRDNEYWQQSEFVLFNSAIAEFIKSNKEKEIYHFLDAGCGDGRLLHYFAPFFDKIDAIEPDSTRLEKARSKSMYWNIKQKIEFKKTSIEKIQEDMTYDFILCNHVVEHLHTSTVDVVLAKFHQLLNEKGILLIATAHSQDGKDFFMKSSRGQDGKMQSELINADAFNNLSKNIEDCVLPVHKMTRKSFEEILLKNGFKIIRSFIYQISETFGEVDNIFFRDFIVNLVPELQERLGQNMAFICHS